MLNSAKSTCQRQFPSPTHSDIKMVTFSPPLQSSPSQVCEFFIFSLLRCLTPMPPCFPLKTFLFALYISALSPFCPLFFNMSIFLSLFISFSPNLSLSHSHSQFELDCAEGLLPSPVCDKSGVRAAPLGQRHQSRG